MAVSFLRVPSPPHTALKTLASNLFSSSISASQMDSASTSAEIGTSSDDGKKKVFVAGSTGRTGKKIVEQLLAKGFAVRAGALDLEKARRSLPLGSSLDIVKADVTEGSEKLAEAIGDAEAVICSTGFRYSWDIFAPWKVDNFGTVNLVEACRKIGVKRFILISSILVNGAAMGQFLNPAYVFLNAFGLTLIAKLQAEQYIRKSGINYTIIRPGGLRDDPPSGNIIMEPEDTLYEGSVSRDQVAEVAVEAILCPESYFKVVEIVSRSDAPRRPIKDLFSAIQQK
ncbi:putative dehydrogenase protein [Dioscorea alata]|uniref:Dehydrogenase protein n=5 Tax=Dioscorea alata TaxID=55571 RepID=A0ACB7UDP7_DIOAL|nr:putative dehydrogenase protein [Dioscorea alata]KAH7658384.1 putative dehydrogenase protein [Dioscorea alata]KAH7658385.1 putative dehydrogenase protein [Dioscorea alata]KAH7658386.1 putative dehydrogenase protein [Dioscorea alata]KAH7658387.1 putative dehydrogenase protein [Dioscorea alata]